MATKLIIKKWGNSLGVVFPKAFVDKKHLEANQEILVDVVKEADLESIFGTLKTKTSGQKFKDTVRAGWE